jgi:hypothetical protein
MDSHIRELLQSCRRPRHLCVDRWYNNSAGDIESRITYKPNERESEVLRAQKAKRRLERWWHKPTDDASHLGRSSDKLLEAKRQRFTADGKQERVSRSLSALSRTSSIQLTQEQWRHIAEDSDVEEQS